MTKLKSQPVNLLLALGFATLRGPLLVSLRRIAV
jgi:hypothetical protein